MKSKVILIIILFFIPLFSQRDIKIVSSTYNSLVVEFEPEFTITDKLIGNNSYKQIKFNSASFPVFTNFSSPAIPFRILSIGVPSENGNSIEIINYSYKTVEGKIIPIPKIKKINNGTEKLFEENENYLKTNPDFELVEFGDFGICRGIPVQQIKINPVEFLPIENKIKYYTKITFKINFSSSQKLSKYIEENFINDAIINYDVAKSWNQNSFKLEKITLTNSVLSSGKWFRFEAPEEGFYKITKTMLSSFGIDANSVNPKTIKIYNNGGKVLPEYIYADRPVDLVENVLLVFGEEDGKFDDNDYILFYSRGTNFWEFDSLSQSVHRRSNIYSKENFYWITSGGNNGKRIQNKVSLNAQPSIIKNSTSAYNYWEEDKINIGKSGRLFLGDEFSETMKSRTYSNKLDSRVQNSVIKYHYKFVNASSSNTLFRVEESSNILIENIINGYSDEYTYGILDEGDLSFSGSLADNRSLLKFTFNASGATAYGYLDFFEINYQKELKPAEDYLVFFSDKSNGNTEYRLSNFSSTDIKVFDVTNFSDVKLISNPITQSGGEYRFQSIESGIKTSKYIALTSAKYKTPVNSSEIKNQNLHGTVSGAELIVIAPKEFKDQAERLKNLKEKEIKIPISTAIVFIDEIYNEFSCGMKDPVAIRDFLRFAYFNWQIKPKYVLLLGDGDYDYKNIEKYNRNIIPAYETEESLDEIYSYCWDDWFAYIDGSDNLVDIALGRLNAQNLSDAKLIVDKIISYETNNDQSVWRNTISLVADDALTSTGPDFAENTEQSETLANNYIPSSFDLKKIYLAMYPTVQTSLGRRKPAVNQAIIDAANNGTVMLNFIGHGSPDLWTHEQVFVKSVSVPQLRNSNYFFLTAATCDFGYFDNPSNQSGAEELVLKDNSGAIGVFSAVRPVYSTFNAMLNQEFYFNLLKSNRDSLNLPTTVGKAYMHTKVNFYDANSQKYFLLGDPSLRLKFPQYSAKVDSVNGFANTNDIQIKALQKVNIKGTIKKADGSNWTNYNGEGLLTIYDSERKIPLPEISSSFEATLQGGVIFRGRISIINGKFSSSFNVPKDISYENKNGRIIFYFYNNESDGLGFSNKIIVGGTDSNSVNDGKGPKIDISFDDLNYQGAYLVTANSNLLIKLEDESGLNTTGTGVGHKLEGIVNDNKSDPIDFTNYFTGDLDSEGKSGLIKFKLNNFEVGEYKIEAKAFDVFNNSSSEISFFKLTSNDDLIIDYVMNYPNPFSSNTAFTFQQNLAAPLNVKIKIFSIAGRLINELENNFINDKFVKINWDGKDKDGNDLANGTYLYKLIIKSVDGTFNKSILGKFTVIK